LIDKILFLKKLQKQTNVKLFTKVDPLFYFSNSEFNFREPNSQLFDEYWKKKNCDDIKMEKKKKRELDKKNSLDKKKQKKKW